MDQKTLSDALRAAGFSLFDRDPYGEKQKAQANLDGRTHYVDNGTLRFFGARILHARPICMGAAFLLVESVNNPAGRETRWVLFDVDGTVIERQSAATKAVALREFWAWFEGFNLAQHYADMMRKQAETMKARAIELAKHARKIQKGV